MSSILTSIEPTPNEKPILQAYADALAKDGLLMKDLPLELKDCESLAKIACYQNMNALPFISKRLQLSKEFLLDCIPKTNLSTLYQALNETCIEYGLLQDKDIALSLVETSGPLLRSLPDCFFSDKEMILTTIKSWPRGFGCANPELKDDVDFCIQALSTNSGIGCWVGDEVRFNTSFLNELYKQSILDFFIMVETPDEAAAWTDDYKAPMLNFLKNIKKSPCFYVKSLDGLQNKLFKASHTPDMIKTILSAFGHIFNKMDAKDLNEAVIQNYIGEPLLIRVNEMIELQKLQNIQKRREYKKQSRKTLLPH